MNSGIQGRDNTCVVIVTVLQKSASTYPPAEFVAYTAECGQLTKSAMSAMSAQLTSQACTAQRGSTERRCTSVLKA
jgi:hypothetical protein